MRYVDGKLYDDDGQPPKGYELLAVAKDADGWVILVEHDLPVGEARFTEWITWGVGYNGQCYGGHYLSDVNGYADLNDARQDWLKRLRWPNPTRKESA